MTPVDQAPSDRFPWVLSQEQVDLLGSVLYRAESTFRAVDPYSLAAERAHELLTEMRRECCRAGAQDPYPFLPLRCELPEEDVAA